MPTLSKGGVPSNQEGVGIEAIEMPVAASLDNNLAVLAPRTGMRPNTLGTYRLRTFVAPDGEVHPLVVGPDSLPTWWPNLWLLTTHRSRGATYGTLASYGQFLCRLYGWADALGISLDQRLLQREWLLGWELDSLVDDLSLQIRGIQHTKLGPRGAGNIQQFLAPKVSKAQLVRVETIATRLHIVSKYLRWLGAEGVRRSPLSTKGFHESGRDEMLKKLLDKIPINHKHSKGSYRTYDREGVLRLLAVTLPGHPENPWRSPEVQLRNHVIVMILFTFGLRIGELGGLKTKDFDDQAMLLGVARRPDDPEDSRGRYAMRQKTRARVMTNELNLLIKTYKNLVRKRHEQALRHPYLLVSEHGGGAISMSALQKVFRELREKISGLPKKLTPHYLRHAWNYEWSKVCKAKGIPADEADQLRRYLQGWSGSSKMPSIYNQPYIQELANECSLETQRQLIAMSHQAQTAFERMKRLATVDTNQAPCGHHV